MPAAGIDQIGVLLPLTPFTSQVGFVVRLEGGRLPAHLQEQLPDYQFAFEGSSGGEVRRADLEDACWAIISRCSAAATILHDTTVPAAATAAAAAGVKEGLLPLAITDDLWEVT